MRAGSGTVAGATLCAFLVLSGLAGVRGQDHPGKAAYTDATCASCHGPSAKGSVGPSLVPMNRAFPDFASVVRQGVGEMPPFSTEQVPDEKLVAIHEYLKSLGGKAASSQAGRALPVPREGGAGRPPSPHRSHAGTSSTR
jgi:mono/diheme cytochrome c family protein